MLDQATKINYSRFLNTPYPWTIHLCPDCQLSYSHPLNFCKECPGKILHFKGTWRKYVEVQLEHMRQLKNKKLLGEKVNYNYHSNSHSVWSDVLPIYPFQKYLGLESRYNEDLYKEVRKIGRAIFPEFSDLWTVSDRSP